MKLFHKQIISGVGIILISTSALASSISIERAASQYSEQCYTEFKGIKSINPALEQKQILVGKNPGTNSSCIVTLLIK